MGKGENYGDLFLRHVGPDIGIYQKKAIHIYKENIFDNPGVMDFGHLSVRNIFNC